MSALKNRVNRNLLLISSLFIFALVILTWVSGSSVEAADRGPIAIRSDSDFTSANGVVSGNGTEANPYIISNWSISGAGVALNIYGTTNYFVVRDMSIKSNNQATTVVIEQVDKGILDNISLLGHDVWSLTFKVIDSSNLTISNMTGTDKCSIIIENSVGILLEDINITDLASSFKFDKCSRIDLNRCYVAKNTGLRGFSIYDSNNITLTNCEARLCLEGVLVGRSYHTSLINCTSTNNTRYDLTIWPESKFTRINQTTFGQRGIYFDEYQWEEIDDGSTVNGKPLVLYTNVTNVVIGSNVGQVLLYNCTTVRISGMTTIETSNPIQAEQCNRLVLDNLNHSGAITAISAEHCRYVTLNNSYIKYSAIYDYGIRAIDVVGAQEFTVMSTTIEGEGWGIYYLGYGAVNIPTKVVLRNITASTDRGNAVYIDRANYTEIEGCRIFDCQNYDQYGLFIRLADHGIITNCTFENNYYGLYVISTGSFIIRNNIVSGGWIAIGFTGSDTLVTNNTVRNLQGTLSVGIDCRPGNGATITQNRLEDCGQGIVVASSDSECSNNTVIGCDIGIILRGDQILLKNCIITDSKTNGIKVYNEYQDIVNCTITNSTDIGIQADPTSTQVNITRCLITGCRIGMVLSGNNGNIYLNHIENSSNFGLVSSGSGNWIYWNSFIMNNFDHQQSTYLGPQAYTKYGDHFDNDIEGNIWDDYTSRYPSATVILGKIWDTPYDIDDGDKDRYPLAVAIDLVPPIADAGEDITIPQNSTVQFDAANSSDDVGVYRLTWIFNYRGKEYRFSEEAFHFTFDQPGVYEVVLTVWDQFANLDTDTRQVTVLDTEAPIPDVGPVINVDMGETFELNGSGSTDNVGITTFTWMLDPGGINEVRTVPSFFYKIQVPGVYFAVLNVSDAAGNWALGSLTVNVLDIIPPVANAGDDQTVDQGTEVNFDGTGSSDNIRIESYVWTISGTTTILSGPQPSYTFVEAGEYNVTLTVTDLQGLSSSDALVVTVVDTESPIANGGDDVIINQGGTVTLDGQASTDNVEVVLYHWSYEIDGVIWDLEGPVVDIKFDDAGEHHVVLRVEDGKGNWGEDIVTITVTDITPPIADAGGDRTVSQGEPLELNGSASTDNVGIVHYEWTIDETDGSIIKEGMTTTHIFDDPGNYQVTLIVTDGYDLSSFTTIIVTVLDITPPIAEAGENITILITTTHKLDGSKSTDNVAIVGYQWSFAYKGRNEQLTGVRPSYYFDTAGNVEITLQVEDAEGNVDIDTVLIKVRPESVEWSIGPFVDRKGNPVRDAKVKVVLEGVTYGAQTDKNGWATMTVQWTDLVSPANVSVSKSGWKGITFNVELDEDGNPTSSIPVMEKKEESDSPGLGILIAVSSIIIIATVMSRRKL